MKELLILTVCAPLFLQAQATNVNAQHVDNPITHNVAGKGPGIVWADNLNWLQVLKKAKKENKYIFVDCFTTWCEPCKKMDRPCMQMIQ